MQRYNLASSRTSPPKNFKQRINKKGLGLGLGAKGYDYGARARARARN